MIKNILFDWGNTLMIDYSDETGPMYTWNKIHAVEYAQSALAEISKHTACFLATNAKDSAKEDIYKALDIVGLSEYITDVFCFKEIGYVKPSKEYFEYICFALQCRPDELLFVGDDYHKDYLGAVNNGLHAILLDTQANASEETRSISSLQELNDLITTI